MTAPEKSLPQPAIPPAPADPDLLQRHLERWQAVVGGIEDGALQDSIARLIDGPEGPVLRACFGNSPFLADCLLKHPRFTHSCFTIGYDAALNAVLEETSAHLAATAQITSTEKILRQARQQNALGIALADLSGTWGCHRVVGQLSAFADWAVDAALNALVRDAGRRGALKIDPDIPDPAHTCGLFAIGMGKLGAHELNYSSDIDLIVLYDPEIVPIARPERLQREMVKLTQGLVDLLQKRTADGYVFRTDLRLRPDPASTPVAMSVDAAEVYYESMGQNWERAAMIKARIVGGDRRAGDAFLDRLSPFIWRRNLDFAAIQDVHSIKRQINAHRGGGAIGTLGHNLKLGRGGIREIEFFAQTQQLIYGGRDDSLRQKPTLAAIRALVDAGRVAAQTADDLEDAYDFLRTAEHRLQMVEDRQTQTLPEEAEPFARFATFMGFGDPDHFVANLEHQLETVERHYAGLFEEAPSLGGPGNLVFTGGEHDPDTLDTLSALGFREPETVSASIRGWHHGRYQAVRSNRARELLTELTPALLAAISETVAPDETFRRFDVFIRSLPAGVQLFSLLQANPGLLGFIADIMGSAPELAETMGRRPALFDAMLDQGFFDSLPDQPSLAADLDHAMPPEAAYEEALDAVRRWCADARFRVGVQLLRGTIDAGKAGRAYSDVADTIVSAILPRVEDAFAERHGRFDGGSFCVLALGKLGGRELTATSDLDLVFVYDDRVPDAQSNGTKPLALSHYYARFAQRLLSALTAPTAEGVPFEIDLRLRPSGNKGPLASSLSAFDDYQTNQAWTWEQMALTRARMIAGDGALADRVMEIVETTVSRQREAQTLAAHVVHMRQRLAENRPAPSHWHVKNMAGGILDIEFTVQFHQLLHSATHSGVRQPGSRAAIRTLRDEGLLPEDTAATLEAAHSLWQTVQAILRLTGAPLDADDRPPAVLHPLLCRATNQPDIRVLEAEMQELASAVRDIYEKLVVETAGDAHDTTPDDLPDYALPPMDGE